MAYRQEYASLTDGELIRLFQEGETHGAFTAILERYQRRIYFAARKMVDGDHDEADELAQDTFVKAYEALGSFRGESQIYTWLYRILMNSVIQKSRKRKTRKTIGIEDMTETVESDENPHGTFEKTETTRLIEEAIGTLPPKQQQVFKMRFYDELPYEDIASIVGTSVGGLKANYFHAVKKIGEYLQMSGKVVGETEVLGMKTRSDKDDV